MQQGGRDVAIELLDGLDSGAVRALELAWEAVCTGNIGVGAVATSPEGRIVHASRNRVADTSAPPGEVAGSSLAHAEINVLARLPFRSERDLTLTTTLQPCLQCSAAIRMAPIRQVRVIGPDPLWDGCGDFTSLNPWIGRRPPVPIDGPRRDELGAFATLLSRLGPGPVPGLDDALRERGEGPLLDLVAEVEHDLRGGSLAPTGVRSLFVELWPRLVELPSAAQEAGGATGTASG